MKKFGIAVAVLVLAVAGAMIAWNIAYPSGTWRYKMTVTVETPEGLKSGSAVREVHAYIQPAMLGADKKLFIDVEGEAVVVDLGKRGNLFALLKGAGRYGEDYAGYIAYLAFPQYSQKISSPGMVRLFPSLKDQRSVLPLDLYPLMVTFKDTKDPKTIEPVMDIKMQDDTNIPESERKAVVNADNFSKLFGSGVKLKEIVVETTKEPVTVKVETSLPWLVEHQNKTLSGERYNYLGSESPLANSLYTGHFISKR